MFTYNDFIQQFEEANQQAVHLTQATDADMFKQRPQPNKWSAAQCLQHLNQFGEAYYTSLNQKLERTEADVTSESAFKPRLIFRIISKYLEPPYKLKIKTVAPFQPENTETKDPEEILNNFSDLQERFIDQLRRCHQKGMNLDKHKISNPIYSFVKMTFTDCYTLLCAHQRRHLWQAEQTVNKIQKAKFKDDNGTKRL